MQLNTWATERPPAEKPQPLKMESAGVLDYLQEPFFLINELGDTGHKLRQDVKRLKNQDAS